MIRGLRSPARLALAVGITLVVLAGIAMVGLLLLGRPRLSVSSGEALVQVKLRGIGAKLTSVSATSDGRAVALAHGHGGLIPVTALVEGQEVRVTVTAKPPSWLRWLLGDGVTKTKLLRTPTAAPSASVALSPVAGQVPVRFDAPVSVVDYRAGGGTVRVVRLDRPSATVELTVPADIRAGSLEVSAARWPWQQDPIPAHALTWFIARPDRGTLALVNPAPDSTGAASNSPVRITFDEPVAKVLGTGRPTITPSVPGSWSKSGPDALVFSPNGFGFGPDVTVTVRFPRPVFLVGRAMAPPAGDTKAGSAPAAQGTSIVAASARAPEATTTYHFKVGPGSVLRLEEILAQLHYLPLRFVPAAHLTAPASFAGEVAAMSQPLPGSFTWRWPSTPSSLKSQWVAGAPNVLLKGALMAFVSDHERYDGYQLDDETVQQIATPATWKALLTAAAANQLDPNPYSYVYVSQSLPEKLTLWESGSVVLTSPTNTGITQSPTANGTFPIYVRFTFNYMSGFNPNGSYYHDPVYWINYFNGGDAVHGFVRSSYGFPQSLGCVELPIPTAQQAFSHLAIGDLVTVAN